MKKPMQIPNTNTETFTIFIDHCRSFNAKLMQEVMKRQENRNQHFIIKLY